MPEIFDCRDVNKNAISPHLAHVVHGVWPGVTKHFISDNNNNTSQMAHGPGRTLDYGIYLSNNFLSTYLVSLHAYVLCV